MEQPNLMLAPREGCQKLPLGDPPLPKPSLTLSLSLSFTIYFQSCNNIDIDIYEKQIEIINKFALLWGEAQKKLPIVTLR